MQGRHVVITFDKEIARSQVGLKPAENGARM